MVAILFHPECVNYLEYMDEYIFLKITITDKHCKNITEPTLYNTPVCTI